MRGARVLEFARPAYRRVLHRFGGIEDYAAYYHDDRTRPTDGGVRVTFLGTTTLLLDDGETQLMTDGFFTRPSLWRVIGSRIAADPEVVDAALDRLKVDRLAAVFVAHSHYDHSLDSAYVARRTGATLHGSASTLNIGRGAGLREDEMRLYEPGEPLPLGRFTVTVLPGSHLPPFRLIDDIGEEVSAPLAQPARARAFKEGGSFTLLVTHGQGALLIVPSAGFVPGALDSVRADAVFLGTGSLGTQGRAFRDAYYAETVAKVRPDLVVPIHWDDFFRPLSERLRPPIGVVDNLPAAFDFLIARTEADGIAFRVLQGYSSILLFDD